MGDALLVRSSDRIVSGIAISKNRPSAKPCPGSRSASVFPFTSSIVMK